MTLPLETGPVADSNAQRALDVVALQFPIQSQNIQDGAVTSAKIAANTITSADIALEAITGATFGTNWTNYSSSVPDATQTPCGSWMDALGNVHVHGLARRITAIFSFPTTIMTLPVAHRPTLTHGFCCYSVDGATNSSTWNVLIAADGTVTGVRNVGTANGGIGTFVYLDGITFRP